MHPGRRGKRVAPAIRLGVKRSRWPVEMGVVRPSALVGAELFRRRGSAGRRISARTAILKLVGGKHGGQKHQTGGGSSKKPLIFLGDPSGSRTRVPDVRGRLNSVYPRTHRINPHTSQSAEVHLRRLRPV